MEHDLTFTPAALELGFVSEADLDSVVDPRRRVQPYVATEKRAG